MFVHNDYCYSTTGGTSVVRQRFAMIHGENDFTFVYEPGIGDTDIYPSK